MPLLLEDLAEPVISSAINCIKGDIQYCFMPVEHFMCYSHMFPICVLVKLSLLYTSFLYHLFDLALMILALPDFSPYLAY